MNIRTIPGSIVEAQVDAIIVNSFSDTNELSGAAKAVDEALHGLLSITREQGPFEGKVGQTATLYTGGKIAAAQVIITGLGEQAKFDADVARQAAAAAAIKAMQQSCTKVATVAHGAGAGGLSVPASAQATVEGMLIGAYRYRQLKTEADLEALDKTLTAIDELSIVEYDDDKRGDIETGAAIGAAIGRSVNRARDLVNAPPNLMGPSDLAAEALRLSERLPVSVEVLDRARLEHDGLNLVVAVGKASARPPLMIVIRYMGRGGNDIDVAYVGKGLTFDSGGMQIKPSCGMATMKGDMAGAAAVLTATAAVAELKLPVNILTVIPAVDNLISGCALLPGDVVTSYRGKTVEIVETDGEGRLILADAVAWAEDQGAKLVIDVATLTGACITALGSMIGGLFCTNDELVNAFTDAAEAAGERFWRMPLPDDYKKKMVSHVADLKNHGGNRGSLLVSALFIGEFIGEASWMHLDIAGIASVDAADDVYTSRGPTGSPVRSLVSFARFLADKGGNL